MKPRGRSRCGPSALPEAACSGSPTRSPSTTGSSRETFIRASGPGGQNVNKVSTAVALRFEAARSPSLPPEAKARLRRLAGRRWTSDGALTITAERHRSQALNRAEAREKLRELILAALERPTPAPPDPPDRRIGPAAARGQGAAGAVKALRGEPPTPSEGAPCGAGDHWRNAMIVAKM